MRHTRSPCGPAIIIAATALFVMGGAPIADASGETEPARALADLAAGIIQCRHRPCPGDTVMDARTLLEESIVSDGVFSYSDLMVAYPSARGSLRGVVEWDFNGGLDAISMKLVDIHVPREVLFAELEHALPGCEMDSDAGGDSPGDDDDIPSTEWSCTASFPGHPDVDVVVYLAPGLAILEID